jgi:hypothetical protein
MTLSKRLWKLPKSTSKKQNIYNNRVKLNRDIHFTYILCLLNNTCVKHNFKSVHVSNLFWSREYNGAKEIYKYPSFSKVGGNYPLDLKIIWSSVKDVIDKTQQMAVTLRSFKRNMFRLRNCSFNFILLQKQYIKKNIPAVNLNIQKLEKWMIS